jgi:serpin B
MNRCGRYNYLETDRFQAIEIPYAESQMAMYIFLPDNDIGVDDFVKQVNPESWHDWLNRMTPQNGMLSLPRFTVEYESRLNDILKGMGMGVAFEPGRADFSGITGKKDIWIDRVQHKTYMDVSPEGTIAAAATAVVMTKGMPMNQNNCDGFNMKVDRPFVCAIYDKKTEAFLFLGAITDPE